MTSVARVKGIELLRDDELIALNSAAEWIGIDVDWLATCISFESGGSFSPSKKNAAGSGATGIIQFMPQTAKNLGTTVQDLAMMTFAGQLEYVKKYFSGWRGALHSLDQVYLAIFYPAAMYKAPDDVIASDGSAVYEQNKGFDRAGTGTIRRKDITGTIESVLAHALSLPRIDIPSAEKRWPFIAIALLGFGALSFALARNQIRVSNREVQKDIDYARKQWVSLG